MKEVGPLLRHVARYLAGAFVSLCFWALWLVLGLMAALQIYIASRNELTVPDFVLRRLEARAAESGLHVAFTRATFDPTGRILVEAPQIWLPDFEDPVVSARAAYVGINPLAFAVGKIEIREVRIIEGTVSVPAMLSPSGRAEPIVRDVDALVLPGSDEIAIPHVSARLGALLVSVHGTMTYQRNEGTTRGKIASGIRGHFREFCQSAVEFAGRLDALEEPSLDLALAPSPTRGAIVTAELSARGFKLDAPIAAQLGEFRATTRFPLLGDTPSASRLQFTAAELQLPASISIRRVTTIVHGRVHPAQLRVDPVEIELAADTVTTPEIVAEDVVAVGRPESPQEWDAQVSARVFGAALALSGHADTKTRSGTVHFAGSFSPRVLDVISKRTHVDVKQFFDFKEFTCEEGTAEFGPGWKFDHLTARIGLRGIDAHGIVMDEGRATVQVDPRHLFAPEAFARIGENYARGTYEHFFATRQFRFLLDGRLRPMDISDWFHGWWPTFFERFTFPAIPPAASVDVRGTWGQGRLTSVFVFADADAPVVLGQPLRRVRTRLFIRPGFYDGLELHLIDPTGGTADGTFAVTADLNAARWRSIDVDARSGITLDAARQMAGKLGDSLLRPFTLAHAPTVMVRGHFDGPAVAGTQHRAVTFETHSSGDFWYQDVPLQDVSFRGALRDDEITLDDINGKFAGGAVRGHARVWGPEATRRMSFSATATDVSLGGAVSALQEASAKRKGQPRPPAGRLVKEKANVRLDANANAEGLYGDSVSFHGTGNAALRGPEIGEVPLFGPLSDLLKFTALRFTSAKADFKINGNKIEFPQIALRGANSAIDAHGEYALDRGQLDFRAKIFPFQESGNVLKSVVGAVLAPISNVLEVKLTGTLEKPDWAFVIGPTNLLRSLAPGEQPPPNAPLPAAATTPKTNAGGSEQRAVTPAANATTSRTSPAEGGPAK